MVNEPRQKKRASKLKIKKKMDRIEKRGGGGSTSASEWKRQKIHMVSSNEVADVFKVNARVVRTYSPT